VSIFQCNAALQLQSRRVGIKKAPQGAFLTFIALSNARAD
jgi:hypothetical protein